MPISRNVPTICLATLTLLCALVGACDDCYTSGVSVEQTCQVSGEFTASLAPGVSFPCPPSFAWTGQNNGTDSLILTVQNDCPRDASFWVNVYIPEGVSAGTYPLPSSDIGIAAHFSPQPPEGERPVRRWFDTADGTLAVVAGTVVVHSSIDYGGVAPNYGLDAALDIALQATSGEGFSVAGRVVASECVLHEVRWCTGD
jgi:hypothetical protein